MKFLSILILLAGTISGNSFLAEDPRAFSGLVHPTAVTLPKGSVYLGLYDGDVLMTGYAVTNMLHIGLGFDTPLYNTAFPAIGFKKGLHKSEHDCASLSVLYKNAGAVSFNSVLLAYSWHGSWGLATINAGVYQVFLGSTYFSDGILEQSFQLRLGKHVRFLGELGLRPLQWVSSFNDPLFQFHPMVMFNFGVRLIYKQLAFDAGGLLWSYRSNGDMSPRINVCITHTGK